MNISLMLRNRPLRFAAVMVSVLALCASAIVTAQAERPSDPEVVFNTSSLIYHRASCSAARRCTRNCVTTTLSDARRRGGRACKLCGGPAPSYEQRLAPQGSVGQVQRRLDLGSSNPNQEVNRKRLREMFAAQ